MSKAEPMKCICGAINARHCPVHQEPRECWVDKSLFEAKGYIQQRVWASDFQRENTIQVIEYSAYDELKAQTELLAEALEKIADPRKRDHREPDAYTALGCVMHMAEEATAQYRAWKE